MNPVRGKPFIFILILWGLNQSNHAAAPYGYYYQQPAPYYYQQRPYPNQYQQPVQVVPKNTPKPIIKKERLPTLSVKVSDKHPYVQQNILLEIKLRSDENLTDLSIEIEQPPQTVLRPSGTLTESDVDKDDKPFVVTTFFYIFMALNDGEININQINIQGKYRKSKKKFKTILKNPINIPIKQHPLNIIEWQPLYQLSFKSKIQNTRALKKGDPIVLQTEIYAEGMTANQISPLLADLKSNEYTIYLDNEVLENGLTPDRHLWGKRQAVYTIVPKFGGKIIIPAIERKWWDLRLDKAKVSILPSRQLVVLGKVNPNQLMHHDNDTYLLNRWFYWIPLFLSGGFMLLFWAKAFGFTNFRIIKFFKKGFQRLFGDFYRPIWCLLQKISPRKTKHILRAKTGRILPTEWKLWYCLRALDKVHDPVEWGGALQILATKHLGARPHSSLRQLADIIAQKHPAANAKNLSILMFELNSSIYGQEPIQNFSFWKRKFKEEIRPRLFFSKTPSNNDDQSIFPKLN